MDDDTLNKLFRTHGETLARIDERTANTKDAVDRMEAGQIRQNGWLADHEGRVSTIEGAKLDTRVATLEEGRMGLKTKVGGGVGIIGLIIYQIMLWFRQQPPLL